MSLEEDLLAEAIKNGVVSSVRFALSRGADPNGAIFMQSPMNYAILCLQGQARLEVVTALYEAGAHVDRDGYGGLPLLTALAQAGDEEDLAPLVDFLIAAGAPVAHGPDEEDTVLVTALETDTLHCTSWRTRRVIAAGADPDAPHAGLLPHLTQRPATVREAFRHIAGGGMAGDDLSEEQRENLRLLVGLFPPAPEHVRQLALGKRADSRFKLKGPRR